MIYKEENTNKPEELCRTTVKELLRKLERTGSDTWWCSNEDKEELRKMNPNTRITCFGECRFRLADDYPSYSVTKIRIDG